MNIVISRRRSLPEELVVDLGVGQASEGAATAAVDSVVSVVAEAVAVVVTAEEEVVAIKRPHSVHSTHNSTPTPSHTSRTTSPPSPTPRIIISRIVSSQLAHLPSYGSST